MKKLTLATLLAGVMATSVAMAIPNSGTIVAYQSGGGLSAGNGGEFTAYVDGSSAGFQTWCIELNNEFSPGTTYNYTLGQTTHDNPAGASPLKLGTAWLVNQWCDGAYSSTLNVAEFQAALWYFQLQGTLSGVFAPYDVTAGGSNIYVAAALAALPGMTGNASADAYGIQVIQVENGQDWVTTPDGGTTILLLGIGLVGVGLVSRRFAVAR